MTLLKKCISLPVADCKNLLRLRPKPRSKFQIASESCAIKDRFRGIREILSLKCCCHYLGNMVLYRKTEMIFADTAETEQTIQEAQGWIFYQKAR